MLLLRQAQLLRDWGPAGEDDDHGHGGAGLYRYHSDTVWVDRKIINPLGFTHIPFASVGHAYSHVPSGGRILFLGNEYPETLTMDKNILLDTVVDPAVIGN